MKVLITEEQLKLIINEQNDDVKLSKAEQQFLQNYIPIPKDKIAAYEQLKSYAVSNGIPVREKEFFKQYPFHTKAMKKLRDKGGKFTNDVQPYDFSELSSAAIAHNQALNRGADNKWSKGEGKKYLKQKADKYNKMSYRGSDRLEKSYNNDLEIEELANMKRLIDFVIDLKNMGVGIQQITGGDDYYHRYKGGLHPQGKAIDFTLKTSNPEIQKQLEEKVAVLISRDPDLAAHLSFINEYYRDTGGSGLHIHIGYKSNGEMSWFKYLTDKDGKNLQDKSHKIINKKILENPKYTELSVPDLETTDVTTLENIPPLGSVKIKGNSLIVDMGEMGTKLGFNLFKIDGDKEKEVPFKKSSGSESKAGVTDSSDGGIRTISIDKMSTKELIRTGTPLFLKVSRVINDKIVNSTTVRTENFIFDRIGNVLTGDEINDYYIKNYEDSPNYLDDFYEKEQMRIDRDIDNTYVKPTPIILPKLDFDID